VFQLESFLYTESQNSPIVKKSEFDIESEGGNNRADRYKIEAVSANGSEDTTKISIKFPKTTNALKKNIKQAIKECRLNIDYVIKLYKKRNSGSTIQVQALHKMINRAVVIMADISGGVIRMCDVFAVNEDNKIENFEVLPFMSINDKYSFTLQTYSFMVLDTVNTSQANLSTLDKNKLK
jgi:hypothetical protein